MASTDQLKQYLAYWFQLGKPVVTSNGTKVLPQPVLQGDRYSFAFEQCWQQLLNSNLNQAHLEGTEQSLGELLTPTWELSPCARCSMPVPIQSAGVPSLSCPCADLPLWPNTELPQPRSPVDSHARLDQIRKRLQSH
ncbi:hypothetical protein IFO70_03420 [Phormidium tenue FACHB-886]|nr:hypothetical protein [Phormidium tenue FACHB-886]